ncbi:MAG: heme ABC transporter ATP-binding protein, partial [Syntrophaceae bacterium]|nr:heme ABC transporter ATP-binding protein [Syntrophaceae bacterium]
MNPILQANNLSFSYNGNRVLTDIRFDVERGDFLGLIGPNGSGKTTLLKLIDGILLPQGGTIHLHGKPLGKMTRNDLAKIIAVVPQAPPMIFPFTVREVILMGRTPHLGRWRFEGARDLSAMENAMAETDTMALADRPMDRLSGGEFHRVLIARALAQEPQILLLDEPTAYLDIRHQVDFFNLLQSLNKEQGLTVIAVTHDINLASFYCNRIVLLNDGEIQAIGHPDAVVTEANIQAVYETPVIVDRHPMNGRPRVTSKQEDP